MLLSVSVYIAMTMKASEMKKKIQEEVYLERFINIQRSGFSLILIELLFGLDSFYDEVTYFSIIGWVLMSIALYFFYKSYY